MNERFEKLAEQCYHPYSEHHINLEKFSELLIQNAADWIRDNYDSEHAEPLAFALEIYFGLHGDYA